MTSTPSFPIGLCFLAMSFMALQSHAQTAADEVKQATNVVTSSHQAGQQSQARINKVDEQTEADKQVYLANERNADLVEAYNHQLRRLIESQQQELTDLQVQIDSIEATEQAMLPMLDAMVEELADRVAADIPMLVEERQQRIKRLRKLLTRADVSLGEKYRLVLQAYQVEVEYGKTMETYSGVVSTDQGEMHVDFFRLGRTALYYQTRDGKQSAIWLPQSERWQTLNAHHNQAVGQAILMSQQLRVPDLLTLPLPTDVIAAES